MIDWQRIGEVAQTLLEVGASLSFIIGIPIAYLEFRHQGAVEQVQRRRELEDQEQAIYDDLVDAFVDWQKLCLQYIYLDIGGTKDTTPKALSPTEQKEEVILLHILMSILERAFLRYSQAQDRQRQEQWRGWEEYIDMYAARENFRKVWNMGGASFDGRFEQFMAGKVSRASNP